MCRNNLFSEEGIINSLRECFEKNGTVTIKSYNSSKLKPSVSTIINRFGSWNNALEKAELPFKRDVNKKYKTKEDFLKVFKDSIRDYKSANGEIPTLFEYQKSKLKPSHGVFYRFNMTYSEALKEIEYNLSIHRRNRQYLTFGYENINDLIQTFISSISNFVSEKGRVPTQKEYVKNCFKPSISTIVKFELNYNKLVKLSGFETASVTKKNNENTMRTCDAINCNVKFKKKTNKRHCSNTCLERMKAYKKRNRRNALGLCRQCGNKMDYPDSEHVNKINVSYCSKCKEYFQNRYRNSIDH